MKKLLLLLALAIGSTFGATAQRSFTVKLGDYAAFAEITTEDINFRHQPNAKSGKLMEWHSDGGSWDTEEVYFFSDENGTRYRANARTGAWVDVFHMLTGQILPIQGTSGEWYKLDMSWLELKSKTQSAYAMQKFFKKIDCATITDKSVCPVEAGYGAFGMSAGTTTKKVFYRSGKYSDLPMAVSYDVTRYSDEEAAGTISFPFFVDDKYVYVVSVYLPITFDPSVSGMTMNWVQEEDVMGGDPFVMLQLTSKPYAENKVEAALEYFFKNISDANFQKFIEHELTAKILDNGSVYFKGSDGKYHEMGHFISKSANALTRTFTFGRGQ